MRRAAFFDLDGTLLAVNSVGLWLRRERREGRLSKRQVARALFFFAGYRLSIVNIDDALDQALQTIKGSPEARIRQTTHQWYREEVAHRAAPGAFPVVAQHRERGDLLVLLTSSSLYASEMARDQFGLHEILCTRYDVQDGLFTGTAPRPYCYGAGKLALAERLAREQNVDLSASAFYTDSYTDLPMLDRVGSPFAVNADPRLRWEARRRGWPHLDWRR